MWFLTQGPRLMPDIPSTMLYFPDHVSHHGFKQRERGISTGKGTRLKRSPIASLACGFPRLLASLIHGFSHPWLLPPVASLMHGFSRPWLLLPMAFPARGFSHPWLLSPVASLPRGFSPPWLLPTVRGNAIMS